MYLTSADQRNQSHFVNMLVIHIQSHLSGVLLIESVPYLCFPVMVGHLTYAPFVTFPPCLIASYIIFSQVLVFVDNV